MPERRPQILFLAHRVPYPPNRGDRIRSYHLLEFLSRRADVHLAFLSDDVIPEQTQRALERVCKRVVHVRLHPIWRWLHGVRSLVTGSTATEGMFYSRKLSDLIASWTKQTQYDVLFVFCSSMAQYARRASTANATVVVDLVDVDSQKWFDYADKTSGPKRWLLRTEGRRLRRLESELPLQSDAIIVVTPQEADVFESFCPDYRPQVVRNGVDLDYFKPSADINHRTSASAGPSMDIDPEPSAVFIGALDYQANIDGAEWFCSEVWPRVRERHPAARFRLVGSRPTDRVLRLGKLPGVDVIGEVPDVRPHLHEATVVTVPLRVARGIQNKVLEALAAAKPVVVSPQGLEGIGAEPGRHLIEATTVSQWVDAIAMLFDSPTQRKTLGQAGRAYVEREYRWATQLEQLCEIPGLAGAAAATAPTATLAHPACTRQSIERSISPSPIVKRND